MDTEKLLGAWTLVSSLQSCNQQVSSSFGDPPSGQLQYTADGRMSAFLMNPDWIHGGASVTTESDRFFAYGGHWQLTGNRIEHSIEFCSAPAKINSVFVRQIDFINEREITLKTLPETSKSGNVYQSTLRWRRHR